MTARGVALSVKQPWAALLAAGVKTVEVRTWPTDVRGPVFLHAAKVPDPRPHGWTFIDTPPRVRAAALAGGLIAVAELVDCVAYPDEAAFAADAGRHRNPASWFRPPRLYGFVFADVRPLPFRRLRGNTFFFPVSGVAPRPSSGSGPTGDAEAEPAPSRLAPPPGAAETTPALPSPAGSVIIIDPPEGKEAPDDRPPDSRPPG